MKWSWEPKQREKRIEGERAMTGGLGEKGTGKGGEEEAKVKDVVEEVERHYRGLARREELAG